MIGRSRPFGPSGDGSAVLIRAVEPISGHDKIAVSRPNAKPPHTTNGPAELTRALQIEAALNGHDITKSPLTLRAGTLTTFETTIQTSRIGITRAIDSPLRFHVSNNFFMSKK